MDFLLSEKHAVPKEGYSGKTMLNLYMEKSGNDCVLNVIKEPHFWCERNRFITHNEIPSQSKKKILTNFSFCNDLGFCILLSFRPHRLVNKDTCLITILDYPGYPVIRFDEDVREARSEQELIKTIPMPPWIWDDDDDRFYNDRICYGVGKEIMTILLGFEEQWPPQGHYISE